MRATWERPWLVGLLALVGFFLMGAGWALALPINGTYDENQHLVRAYAVADGQLLPSGHGFDAANLPAETFRAPRGLLPKNVNCTWFPKPPKPASCQREEPDTTLTDLPSQAARYSPVYYALVGWPLLAWPNLDGVILARLLSALFSALLLAAAVTIAVQRANRLLVAAIVLVSTPMVMNLSGAVNQSGLEITSGVLLFVAMLAVLGGQGSEPARRWWRVAAVIAGGLLLTNRLFGPVLFAGILAACAVTAGRQRVGAFLRDKAAVLSLGVPFALATCFAAWWVWFSRAGDIQTPPEKGFSYSLVETLLRLPGERFRFYADQVVGRFSYGETTASPLLILAWYGLFAALVIPALWLGSARLRLTIAGVFFACLGILVALEVHFVPIFGWFSHSRYVAPLGVGVVLLAATSDRWEALLERRGWLGIGVITLVGLTIPLDAYAMARVMSRFQVGIAAAPNPFGGSWEPVVGSLPPLVSALAGAVALTAAVSCSVAVAGIRLPRFGAWQTENAVSDRKVVARKDEVG